MRRFLLPLVLAIAVMVGVSVQSAPAAHAAPAATRLHFQRGYSLQGPRGAWLCYGWSNGAYHCTQHHNGYHSLNPNWVPNNLDKKLAAKAPAKAAPARQVASFAKPGRNPYPFGQCTFGAYQLAHNNVGGLGNAKDWFRNAQARGLPTGSTPRVGATVVFQPGVQGASRSLGHVAHVVAVGPNGTFLIQAMNDVAGFGHFGFRWVHAGPGVGFIY